MSDILSHPLVRKIKDHLRVTKVVCTRSVKGSRGDTYVGFSAGWDSIQDDAGGGGDMLGGLSEGDVRIATSQIGMTFKEAKVASLMLGLQVDLAAHDHAAASGNITPEQRTTAVHGIKINYSRLLVEVLGADSGEVKNG